MRPSGYFQEGSRPAPNVIQPATGSEQSGHAVAGADFSGATFEDEDQNLVGLCVDTFQNECDVSKCDKNTHKKKCKKTCNLC